jgi:Zn-dependent protease
MTQAQRIGLAVLIAVGAWLVLTKHVIHGSEVVFFAALLPSIILHEVAHGWAALAFGDDTAKRAGRLTLNPIAHIDPVGSVLLPAVMILSSGAAFGYAKPVPVNQRRMRSPRNHGLLVALAGPATNVVLAAVSVVVIRFKLSTGEYVFYLGLANVILAVFNMIPVPPLDGSALIERVLPARLWPGYLRLRQYAMVLVLLLVFVMPLDRLFDPAVNFWIRLLG